jgi:hypothetical protein
MLSPETKQSYQFLQTLNDEEKIHIANLLLDIAKQFPNIKENENAMMELAELIEAFS